LFLRYLTYNFISYKNELPQYWKESIIAPVYKKGDKTSYSNYRGTSIFSATYKILSNILLSRLNPQAKEITGDNQCGFRRNVSTTDHIFCVHQILQKEMDIQRGSISDFKRANDSVRKEVFYNTLIAFCVPKKLVQLIEMCLNETHSTVQIGKLFV
jgi:hypothetical protein